MFGFKLPTEQNNWNRWKRELIKMINMSITACVIVNTIRHIWNWNLIWINSCLLGVCVYIVTFCYLFI